MQPAESQVSEEKQQFRRHVGDFCFWYIWMNMDFTVLENTQGGSSLYACHEETERKGQDGGERGEQQKEGLPGKRTGARHD